MSACLDRVLSRCWSRFLAVFSFDFSLPCTEQISHEHHCLGPEFNLNKQGILWHLLLITHNTLAFLHTIACKCSINERSLSMYHPARRSNYPTHCGWTEIDTQTVFRANVSRRCRDRRFCTTQLHPTNSEYRQHAGDCGRGG